MFTDAIDASFKDLFERAQKGTDVSVQARLAVDEPFAPPPTMPADTLERVEAVPGVDEAFGSVSSENGALLDKKGEPITLQRAADDHRHGRSRSGSTRSPTSRATRPRRTTRS